MIFKPMLAGEVDLPRLRYPVFASVKLDGVRAIVRGGVVYSRNNKPIPNKFVQARFGHLEHYDGELIFGSPTDPACYRNTVSAVMSENSPDGREVVLYAFDFLSSQFSSYETRYNILKQFVTDARVVVLPQKRIENEEALLKMEAKMIAEGHEGLIVRGISSPYKMGRSTTREGFLLKLKRFKDCEFQVVGFVERMHNANEATTNELGHMSRSSHQENMIPRGDLGALICDYKGQTFNVGTGFDDATRKHIWECRGEYLGKQAKVRYFEVGMKDLPRHPVFLGFREED